jgi:hypothetical protein
LVNFKAHVHALAAVGDERQPKLNRVHMLNEALRSFVMRVAWEERHRDQGELFALSANNPCLVPLTL